MARSKDVAFVLPVFNEGKVVGDVIGELLKRHSHVICIDDGSTDNSAEIIAESGAYLVSHPINMGQGAALQTGMEFAQMIPEVKYVVTFDSDGQHSIDDAEAMISELKSDDELDIVLGSRFLGDAVNLSASRRIILKSAVLFTNLTSRIKLTDTHNGLRAMTVKAASKINLTLSGMGHASEFISLISQKKLNYKEVPVTIIYSDYSKTKKHGQTSLNAINIISELLFRGRQ